MRCLIVNRGEIALRAIQSCQELGLVSVWLTSEAERWLEPGLKADETVAISEVLNSSVYMDLILIEKVLIEYNISYLYPGYGFLSEKSELAELCESLNVCFIGPASTVLSICGHKARAQQKAISYGIETLRLDLSHVVTSQDWILVKASQGGGGRGHRIVAPGDDLHAAISETKNLSRRLFSSDEVHTERYSQNNRHVEAQFARGHQGKAVLLGTRDCSVQRRFQKVIEEGEVSSEIFQAIQSVFEKFQKFFDDVNYVGIGTIEFVWDLNLKRLYFIEINCRIQVEHPVTEVLTGRNLVTDQIRIFLDQKLNDQMTTRGHAIECRIYGEDPENGFTPSPKKIEYLRFAHPPFVRWDWSLQMGDHISTAYDPMIGKLICWGCSREEAILRAVLALKNLVLHGPKTNQEFLLNLLQNEVFVQNRHTTAWLDSYVPLWKNDKASSSIHTKQIPILTDESSEVNSQQNWKSIHKLQGDR